MKISNRLFAILAGLAYILLAIFLFVNPGLNLVAASWMLSFGFFVSAITAILSYFSLAKDERQVIYLVQGILELLFAIYLLSYGYVTLPVVIPTVLGIWLIIQAIVMFTKARRLRWNFPIIGNKVTWLALVPFLLGLLLFFHPLFASVFVVYFIAFGFLSSGVQSILEAFRK